jgi:hypothetical protein
MGGELGCAGAMRELRNRAALTAIAARRSFRLIFIGVSFAHLVNRPDDDCRSSPMRGQCRSSNVSG